MIISTQFALGKILLSHTTYDEISSVKFKYAFIFSQAEMKKPTMIQLSFSHREELISPRAHFSPDILLVVR